MAANTLGHAQSEKALIRRRQVEQLVQLSRSSIYAAVKNRTFPPPYRIGARAVAWKQSEVLAWLEARPLASATA
jgi:prophage regulatory protein